MITITGGKLTTWRRMAKMAVDRLVEREARTAPCRTHEVPLGQAVDAARLPRVEGVPDEAYERLAGRYGHAAHEVLAVAGESGELAQPIVAGGPADLLAEAVYAARREQALSVGRRAAAPHAHGPARRARRRRPGGRDGAARRGGDGGRAGVGRPGRRGPRPPSSTRPPPRASSRPADRRRPRLPRARLAADELDERACRGWRVALAAPDERDGQPDRGVQAAHLDVGSLAGR